MNRNIYNNIMIKLKNGNIQIKEKLLNTYNNVTELMNNKIDNFRQNAYIIEDIVELNEIDLQSIGTTEVYRLAIDIFKKYNVGNVFYNNGNKKSFHKL